MTELTLAHLARLSFELERLRLGLLEKYSRAFYVPRACHSLNLVVIDTASCTTEITTLFSIVQELSTFLRFY